MFKKGDKVRSKVDKVISKETARTDIVELVPGMEEYDRAGFANPEIGFVLEKNRWEYQTNWEKIDEETITSFDPNKAYTNILEWTLRCQNTSFYSTEFEKNDAFIKMLKKELQLDDKDGVMNTCACGNQKLDESDFCRECI